MSKGFSESSADDALHWMESAAIISICASTWGIKGAIAGFLLDVALISLAALWGRINS